MPCSSSSYSPTTTNAAPEAVRGWSLSPGSELSESTPSTCPEEISSHARALRSWGPPSTLTTSMRKPAACATAAAALSRRVGSRSAGAGSSTASRPVRRVRMERATRLGRYPSSSIAASTRRTVSGLSPPLCRRYRETVWWETCARRATWMIVGRRTAFSDIPPSSARGGRRATDTCVDSIVNVHYVDGGRKVNDHYSPHTSCEDARHDPKEHLCPQLPPPPTEGPLPAGTPVRRARSARRECDRRAADAEPRRQGRPDRRPEAGAGQGTTPGLEGSRGLPAPWFLGLFVITIGPMLASLYLSLHRLQPAAGRRSSSGWTTSPRMLGDERLHKSLGVTLHLRAGLGAAAARVRAGAGASCWTAACAAWRSTGRCSTCPRCSAQRRHRRAVAAGLRRRGPGQPVPGPVRHRGPRLDLRARAPRWAR